ncbi:MAG: chorismate mutase [Hornefia sp.]|nr:chorismate mutase [Hornefia sp.]
MNIQTIEKLRGEIDVIDEEIVNLFQMRMKLSRAIGEFKSIHEIPVLDHRREEEKLKKISELADKDMEEYCHILYNKILEMSRDYQNKI